MKLMGEHDVPHTKTTSDKHMLLEGVVKGIPRRTQRAVVDGIVSGIACSPNPRVGVETMSVKASATPLSRGDFGAGTFAQGAGRGKILKGGLTTPAPAPEPKKKRISRAKKAVDNVDLRETQAHGQM